ncbi:hypothetical protein [uncultured Eubacterium sp.]|uniref:hypothetical protein n=1 Tax=uncultured Eubacterium sp. TaxID=165185 RepID=UPI002672EAA7|nr:hypothetical protein [uncultured Eubacterium sp.]
MNWAKDCSQAICPIHFISYGEPPQREVARKCGFELMAELKRSREAARKCGFELMAELKRSREAARKCGFELMAELLFNTLKRNKWKDTK